MGWYSGAGCGCCGDPDICSDAYLDTYSDTFTSGSLNAQWTHSGDTGTASAIDTGELKHIGTAASQRRQTYLQLSPSGSTVSSLTLEVDINSRGASGSTAGWDVFLSLDTSVFYTALARVVSLEAKSFASTGSPIYRYKDSGSFNDLTDVPADNDTLRIEITPGTSTWDIDYLVNGSSIRTSSNVSGLPAADSSDWCGMFVKLESFVMAGKSIDPFYFDNFSATFT